jgi:vancomycin resistance protein YoaR
MTAISYPYARPVNPLAQVLAALAGGALLFLGFLFIWTLGYPLLHAGRILPGVSVAGVDLTGLTPAQAALKMEQSLAYPHSGRLMFQDGGRVWLASPAELGMYLDTSASARSAYRFGRSGGLFGRLTGQMDAWRSGVDLAPIILIDQRVAHRYLQALALEIDQPVVEAHLSVQGTTVVAEPGQIGRTLHVEATLMYLNAQLQTFRDGEVPLHILEQAPEVLDVSLQAEAARRLLSTPLVLSLPDAVDGDPGPWTIDVPALAGMLVIERVQTEAGAGYRIALDPQVLRPVLEKIAGQVNREPENARFIFNDDTRQLDLLRPALIGRRLDVDTTIQTINESILQDGHAASLVLDYSLPLVGDTATAESLGISELVVQQTSYFYGSSGARIQNIQTSAARFHGLLVAPGETFSMAAALGDISLDNGYTEALIIYGGRTIKGIGGGVCQVSTTLFRTAFFGGFPILERHPHAYRVYYYELTRGGGVDSRLAGLDAAVFVPLVDLKFKNDTPYWLLMETYVNPGARTITWKFYSTSDGRTVTMQSTGLQNKVPAPEPLFQVNTELSGMAMRQIDWAAEGADVTVTRTVHRDGQVLFQDSFRTRYQAWQAICEYSPDIEDPEAIAAERGLCQP